MKELKELADQMKLEPLDDRAEATFFWSIWGCNPPPPCDPNPGSGGND